MLHLVESAIMFWEGNSLCYAVVAVTDSLCGHCCVPADVPHNTLSTLCCALGNLHLAATERQVAWITAAVHYTALYINVLDSAPQLELNIRAS